MRARRLYSAILSLGLFLTVPASADVHDGELDGEYVPVKGWVRTMEVSRPALGESPRQIGKYKLVLKRKDWDLLDDDEQSRIRKRLVIKGLMTGTLDPATGLLDHVLTNKERTGVLYSLDDLFIPTQGDPFCSSGVSMQGSEQVNVVSGAGEYAGLVSGTLFVLGTVNNCPGNAEFLQNNFTVQGGQGSLIFSTN